MWREGAGWDVVPTPTVSELRADAKGDHAPWSIAVKEIVRQTKDLTVLWQVGVGRRQAGNARAFERWTESDLLPADVDIGGTTTAPELQAMLDANRDTDGPPVRPARVLAARDEWFEPPPVEFCVDFKTVSNLNDDFSRIPERGGQDLIFMIGC